MPARRLHLPLLALTALMAVCGVVNAALAIVAPVEIVGTNGWFKPLKFSISIAIFAATIALILDTIGQTAGRRFRWLWWLGTVIAALLLVEQVIIMGFELVDQPIAPKVILVDGDNRFVRDLTETPLTPVA